MKLAVRTHNDHRIVTDLLLCQHKIILETTCTDIDIAYKGINLIVDAILKLGGSHLITDLIMLEFKRVLLEVPNYYDSREHILQSQVVNSISTDLFVAYRGNRGLRCSLIAKVSRILNLSSEFPEVNRFACALLQQSCRRLALRDFEVDEWEETRGKQG